MTIAITTPSEWLSVSTVKRNSHKGSDSVELEEPILVYQTALISWQLPDVQNADGTLQQGWAVELFPARRPRRWFRIINLTEGCWLQRCTNQNSPEQVDEIIIDHKTGLAVVSNFLCECHPK